MPDGPGLPEDNNFLLWSICMIKHFDAEVDGEVVVTTGAIRCAELWRSNHHHPAPSF